MRLVICRLWLVICRLGRRVVGRRGRGRSITRKRLHYSKTVVVVNQLVRDIILVSCSELVVFVLTLLQMCSGHCSCSHRCRDTH